MKTQTITLIAMIFLVLPMASATISDFGIHKQGTNITLYQVCSNCTYNNITVITPNSSIVVSNELMLKADYQYTYILNASKTLELGQYKVHGMGDDNGIATFWSYTFDITKTGFSSQNTNFMLLLIALFVTIAILLTIAFILGEGHAIISIAFAGIGFFLLNVVLQVANMAVSNNYIDSGMTGMIETVQKLLTWMDYALIVYIIVYVMIKVISGYGQRKQEAIEGLR